MSLNIERSSYRSYHLLIAHLIAIWQFTHKEDSKVTVSSYFSDRLAHLVRRRERTGLWIEIHNGNTTATAHCCCAVVVMWAVTTHLTLLLSLSMIRDLQLSTHTWVTLIETGKTINHHNVPATDLLSSSCCSSISKSSSWWEKYVNIEFKYICTITTSFVLELTETDDAYILEVDTQNRVGPPAPPPVEGDQRFLANNDLVNGLVVGAGAGLVGSLVVGALLDQSKKHNNCRNKRDRTGR